MFGSTFSEAFYLFVLFCSVLFPLDFALLKELSFIMLKPIVILLASLYYITSVTNSEVLFISVLGLDRYSGASGQILA